MVDCQHLAEEMTHIQLRAQFINEAVNQIATTLRRSMNQYYRKAKNPTVPMKASSSLKVLIARITPKPTSGTAIIRVAYPATQIPP